MNTYDFHTLNDKEFEALSVDLLSTLENKRYERFKPGRDKGVDGRWFIDPQKEAIVQCKHWVASGFDLLLSNLKSRELVKIQRLKPYRYILITSVPLSRLNKQKIAKALAPFVLAESDIFGSEDVNDLLLKYPEIERRHYKLWLSSSGVLRSMLNASIEGRSLFELEHIREESPLYVITSDFEKAYDHLRVNRVIILTGEPGVGKTTLARQLVLDHASMEYQILVIEESISEAEAAYVYGQKQLFYFDDFLGRTFLDALKPKHDSHIVNFIRRVARDGSKRFVLTSRTNILNQGFSLTDAFDFGAVERNRYELKIGSLSTMDKARILYNHIWHSKLNASLVDELYKDRRYREVVKHRNYNPRLIAFIVDDDKVAGTAPEHYWNYVSETMANPKDIWAHFFDNQMTQDERDLVYLTVLNGTTISEAELRNAFAMLHLGSTANIGALEHRFRRGAKHCSGSILNRAILDNGQEVYSLFNPSVADFIQARLPSSELPEYYYPALRTIGALSQLAQYKKQAFFGAKRFQAVLRLLSEKEDGADSIDPYSLRLARMIAEAPQIRSERRGFLERWVSNADSQVVDWSPSDYMAMLVQTKGVIDSVVHRNALDGLTETLESTFLPLDEADLLKAVLTQLHDYGFESSERAFRRRIIDDWAESVADEVRTAGTLDGYYDHDETDAAVSALQDAVTDWLWESGVQLDSDELERLCDVVDVHNAISRNQEQFYHDDDEARGSWHGGGEGDDMRAVDDLFDRSGL